MTRPPKAAAIASRILVRYSTVDDEIAYLYDLGWPVIPCCAPSASSPSGCTGKSKSHTKPRCGTPGKVPLLVGFGRYASSLPQLDQLLFEHGEKGLRRHRDANRAVVVPVGHVVVEADSPEADAELAGLLTGLITPTRAPRPGRGHAYFLRLPPGVEIRSTNHIGANGAIDVKAAKSIIVIPDSVHKSGHVYRWVVGQAPWEVEIHEIPDELLELVLDAKAKRPSRTRRVADLDRARDPDQAQGPDRDRAQGQVIRSDNTPPARLDTAVALLGPGAEDRDVDDVDATGHACPEHVIATAADAGVGVCCPIVRSDASLAASSSTAPLAPRHRPPPDVDGLIQRLDSTARKIATEGYVDHFRGGSFSSRSEMRFALALAGLYAGGTRREIKELLLRHVPNAFRHDDHRDLENHVVDQDFEQAEGCFYDEIDGAMHVKLFFAYVSRTRRSSPDVAQVRATLCLVPSSGGDRVEHTVNIRLGKPALGDLGGEWLQALRALPDEPLLPRAEDLLVEQEARAHQRGEILRYALVPGRRTECLLVRGTNGAQHLLPRSTNSEPGAPR